MRILVSVLLVILFSEEACGLPFCYNCYLRGIPQYGAISPARNSPPKVSYLSNSTAETDGLSVCRKLLGDLIISSRPRFGKRDVSHQSSKVQCFVSPILQDSTDGSAHPFSGFLLTDYFVSDVIGSIVKQIKNKWF